MVDVGRSKLNAQYCTESFEIETKRNALGEHCTHCTEYKNATHDDCNEQRQTHMCTISVAFLLNEHTCEGQKFQKKYLCIFNVLVKFDTSKGETHPFPFSISISSSLCSLHYMSCRFFFYTLHETKSIFWWCYV